MESLELRKKNAEERLAELKKLDEVEALEREIEGKERMRTTITKTIKTEMRSGKKRGVVRERRIQPKKKRRGGQRV